MFTTILRIAILGVSLQFSVGVDGQGCILSVVMVGQGCLIDVQGNVVIPVKYLDGRGFGYGLFASEEPTSEPGVQFAGKHRCHPDGNL